MAVAEDVLVNDPAEEIEAPLALLQLLARRRFEAKRATQPALVSAVGADHGTDGDSGAQGEHGRIQPRGRLEARQNAHADGFENGRRPAAIDEGELDC